MSAIKDDLDKAEQFYQGQLELTHYNRLFEKTFIITPRNAIKSGGYIVHTLEAAVWCLLTTKSYKEAVLKAINLGDDTDTVAAVTGGLAGTLYGYDTIPNNWRKTLIKGDYIESMSKNFIKS